MVDNIYFSGFIDMKKLSHLALLLITSHPAATQLLTYTVTHTLKRNLMM